LSCLKLLIAKDVSIRYRTLSNITANTNPTRYRVNIVWMVRQLKVRGIAILNGKLLCLRNKARPGKNPGRNEFWCLPGGNVENKEALITAFKREIVEELGIEPVVGRLIYVHQFLDKKNHKEVTEFFFHIENAEDYSHIDLATTTHGHLEIEEVDYVDPKTTVILPEFLKTENLAELLASSHPAKIIADY
jgi:8-oxo-dGTP pyrophosphatase MutT (NUDIX family)